VIVAGLGCFAGSAWSIFTRQFFLGRAFAISEISLLLLGWGLAQFPYLVYPDLPFTIVAAPVATLRFVVLSLPVGAALILPSLWFLMQVFKAR
jgi:cytochrome d ubiquinol oxidase subunit II